MKFYLAGLALLLTLPVVADDHVDIVKRAFLNISDDFHQEWAFTESIMEDGVAVVGRYDPRLAADARWNLLTVDGRTPTPEEMAEYQDDREFRFGDRHSDGEMDMVDFDTLELIVETDDAWFFEFVPDVDNDEDEEAQKFMQEVQGTIKVVRDGNYLEYLELRNDKPIRPAFSVKISRFRTRLTFGPAGGNGPIVPLSIDVELKGRALLVIKIDEVETVRYGDYEYVGS